MDQCNRSYDAQDQGSESTQPVANSTEAHAKQPATAPKDWVEQAHEPGVTPLLDWTAATREVLEGLSEEVTQQPDAAAPNDTPVPQVEPCGVAQRKKPPQTRRAADERPSRPAFTLEQRVFILDLWATSKLSGTDFGPLVGVAPQTLYIWRRAFEKEGPAGLVAKPRGAPSGSRLPEATKRAILLMKQAHPEWGCQRISDMLMRGPALAACAASVANVLHDAGYELEELPTKPHPPEVHRFERARPNQLWQTDLFTFILKRQNRRVYLVAFMDDHSRFITSFGLHASQTSAL